MEGVFKHQSAVVRFLNDSPRRNRDVKLTPTKITIRYNIPVDTAVHVHSYKKAECRLFCNLPGRTSYGHSS